LHALGAAARAASVPVSPALRRTVSTASTLADGLDSFVAAKRWDVPGGADTLPAPLRPKKPTTRASGGVVTDGAGIQVEFRFHAPVLEPTGAAPLTPRYAETPPETLVADPSLHVAVAGSDAEARRM
jgi:hypothetical protein